MHACAFIRNRKSMGTKYRGGRAAGLYDRARYLQITTSSSGMSLLAQVIIVVLLV